MNQDTLALTSPTFGDGQSIPVQYSCHGQNINPPLNIVGVPHGSQSLALIMHDPDAPGRDFLHWLMWDIPPSTDSIAVSGAPIGAVQGKNDAGKTGYMGPCPPAGTGVHRYVFELFALDTPLSLERGASRKQLEDAMAGHIIGQTTLTGTFSAGH